MKAQDQLEVAIVAEWLFLFEVSRAIRFPAGILYRG